MTGKEKKKEITECSIFCFLARREGRLVNMWKKFQAAKVVQYVHHFKKTKHSALKKDADLFALLSTCKSELTAKQCDELVASIVFAAAQHVSASAPLLAAAVSDTVAALSTSALNVLSGSGVTDSSDDKQDEGRFLEINDSPYSSGGAARDRKKTSSTKTRVAEWSEWIRMYITDRDAFVRRFSRTRDVEAMTAELLRAPMEDTERPVVETLFSYVVGFFCFLDSSSSSHFLQLLYD